METKQIRAWAMRTSRNSEQHRQFVKEELERGVLRQGWGYQANQDLVSVRTAIEDPARGWSSLTEDQKWAWGHWRMLGEAAADKENAMQVGDIVLVPNVPEDGYFTLCRITGPYEYEIDSAIGDLGHKRAVEVLTPNGVANTHEAVDEDLRRSLRCRSRLWGIGHCSDSINRILELIANGKAVELRAGSNHVERAKGSVRRHITSGLNGIVEGIRAPLQKAIGAEEWETVLCWLLKPLLLDIEVSHTGGPGENGADLEIQFPNPFDTANPWVIAVQVKDYQGEVGPDVADQLEKAITSRQKSDSCGGLIAVILATTNAKPSKLLSDRMDELKHRYGVAVSCVDGEHFMQAVARGFLARHLDCE